MHRFRARSKSDASKRSVSEVPPPTMPPKLDLPPAEDFRTSLIMPSLSRRFTLLRGQNGEPLSIDDVRSRLAQQRANGHVNHVTEEEEQVMIDALIRAHSIDPTASSDSDGYTTATANDGYSTAHTNDYSLESPRYAYPAKAVVKHQPALSTSSLVSKSEPKDIAFDSFLSNSTFSPAQIRRASLALQDAIQEFDEDEDDEQILAPRKVETQDHDHAESPVRFGEAIAWPNDQSPPGQDASSSASVPYNPSSPGYTKMDAVNRVPGYVPGMHRPITPRDSAVDTDTTGTSTPQPASNEYSSTVSSPGRSERGLPQSILLNKRASTTNSPLRTRPRELSDAQYDSASDSTQTPLKSALSDRRRPTSPLVDSAYQSAIRAGTPSNNFADAWSPTAISFASSPSSRNVSSSSVVRASHLRDTSTTSNGADSNDSYYSSRPQSRSAASPESPTVNGSSGLANIVSAWNGASTNVIVDEPVHRTSTPRLSVLENGAQRGVRSYSPHARAGTPNTHTRRGNHSRSGSLATDARSSAPRPNPLLMSPMLNSSRSSLASTGSSYHSWDEDQLGGKKPHKRGVSVFIDSDSAPWKKRRSGFDFDFEENAPAPEELRDVLAGLTVQDMLAVQDRLVSAAVKKRVSMPARPLSGQRKRRASAGQSMTSMASPVEPGVASPPRIASPPPVAQTPPPALAAALQPPSTPPRPKSAEDQAKKANALLHAMMDSIESSPHKHTPSPAPVAEPINPQVQALASQPSFSSEEPQSITPPSPADEPQTPDTPIPEQDPRQKALADALFGSDSDATVKDSHFTFGRSQSLRAFAMPPVASEPAVNKEPSPALETRNENRSLAEDVERRAAAATAALKSASTPRLHETNGAATNGRKAGKKFNTRQISSPQLVSATTSVDTIALAAAAAANGNQQPPHTQSKLSQRFKKLTGNLRTRAPIPTGDEISPFVMETTTPPTAEPTQASPRSFPSLEPPKSAPLTTSESPGPATPATPTYDDSPSSAPGTPTSGQPRLRGLMARLRKGRKDSTDTRDKAPRAPSPLNPNGQAKPIPPPPHIPAAMLKPSTITMPENMSTSSLAPSGSGIEAPPPPPPPPPVEAEMSHVVTHAPAQSQQVDEDALRQLYDAASQLGLDKSAINDILVRSQSTSSRSTAWTHASTLVAPSTTDKSNAPPLPPPVTLDRSMSMTTPKAARGSASLGRQLSLKPYTGILPLRTATAAADDNPTPTQTQASVIRRTVIFPSPAGRVSSDMSRRPSMSKHRRTRSGSIHSNKSVSERAPTPPPSRAPAIKRFSKELFPPVPQLPSGVEGTLQVSRSASAFGSASNYDSLYDMYAEGGQDSTLEGGSAEQAPVGSAVEVLELSDGQIVWSVVDGLRAAGEDYEGDDPSVFPRMSRASEYSTPETHELRFREHQRSASKSSVASTASKPQKPSPPNRPETRVYFSSAGDIGTLIDSLTKNSEAGQFNIVPGLPTIPTNFGSLRPQSGAQSTRSFNTSYNSTLPDGDWTLEERIDQMIAANHKRSGL